ncbi:Metallo-dependent phosphatase-like protein [Leucosporidium creatinivorum]|uniref:Serine/threonine-protein phosphatase n=1 Tax=Leucosporidium creatinivorum TaxID=106004 RepID=A0A1Y2DTW2_9BASI|nr:Metallo-dependent phosphatase-like protein [Leucosporidium creatinivorum]
MAPSLFSDTDSPTDALPTPAPVASSSSSSDSASDSGSEYSPSSEYCAPLGGHAPDPSIDGTSVGGGEGGIRAENAEDVSDADKQTALRIKSEANALFSASKYRPSLDMYTASLNKNPFDPIVWSNRSAVRLKLEEHGLAIADASLANIAIMKPKAAVTDLKKVLSLDPKNGPAKAQLDATQKLLRRLQFEAAISSKDEIATSVKIADQLAQGASPIDADYKGPRLPEDGKPTAEFIDELIEWFKDGNVIPRRIAWQIVLGAFEVLKKEPSLVDAFIPEGETINVIGDTHGQFYDFYHLLSLTGRPSATHSLLFNGDFVDRGSWSTEIVIILFAYKWLYPGKIFLNRGNHETADMNKVYGFEGETKKKYSELTYKLFEEVFTALPLSTLITAAKPPRPDAAPNPKNPTLHHGVKRHFVVHGGLFSREDVMLDEIRKIPRLTQKQPGHEGLMCEMLWTDPQDAQGRGPSKRGVGIGFGPDVTRRWTEKNEVTAIIRSHEVRQGGYSVEHDGLCITVFSAPNYVDQVGNLAAFATIDDTGDIQYTTFSEQPHPAYAGGLGGGGF